MARIFCLLSLVLLVASFPLINRFISGMKLQDKKEIEAIIEEYIYKNPSKVVNAISKGQAAINSSHSREKVLENKKYIEDLSYPHLGEKEGKVLLIEFFDYSCGYCRAMLPYIKQLIEDDKSCIVFRDLPVLGEASMIAARAALAVHFINPAKYIDFYYAALKHDEKFTQEGVIELVESIGISREEFMQSMGQNEEQITRMISRTLELADRLDIGGTPSLVIGENLLVGASDINTLRSTVEKAVPPKR